MMPTDAVTISASKFISTLSVYKQDELSLDTLRLIMLQMKISGKGHLFWKLSNVHLTNTGCHSHCHITKQRYGNNLVCFTIASQLVDYYGLEKNGNMLEPVNKSQGQDNCQLQMRFAT